MKSLQFKLFESYKTVIRHGLSMRDGGVSSGVFESLNLGLDVGDKPENVVENYRRFSDAVGFSLENLCVAHQEHTDTVVRVEEGVGFDKPFRGIDGFVTNRAGIPLMVRFADCQGILYFDPVLKVIGAVHSGWRGNAKNIVGKAVQKMVGEYGCKPENILVGVSQSLGTCCAEFTDPIKELPEFMHKYIQADGKHVNLWDCCFDELVAEGILPTNTEMLRRCTMCENDKFFSFRGAGMPPGKSGHMGGVIEMVSSENGT